MKQYRFAYLSANDPLNKKVWSGTHYSIYKVIKSIGNVEILGPYEPKLALLFLSVINQVSLKLFRKRISYRHGVLLSKLYANYFNKKIQHKSFDFIIAPAASLELAYLNTQIPIIYITDGTFKSCLNYHKSLSNLSGKSIIEGNWIESQAISKSKFVVVSSEWAAQSVEKDYGKNSNQIIKIPYGANFDRLPDNVLIEKKINHPFKLLFVGVYWETKGGNIAFNCFKLLLEKGYDVSLTVVGCMPPENIVHPKLEIIEFIDKNTEIGQKALCNVYQNHHALLLPTRFDCTPIVINEASAFALPSLVSNSGGVAGHLKPNVNGYLIDYNDQGEGFTDVIEELILNPELYYALRKSCRAYYEEQLNWDHWKEEFLKVLTS